MSEAGTDNSGGALYSQQPGVTQQYKCPVLDSYSTAWLDLTTAKCGDYHQTV